MKMAIIKALTEMESQINFLQHNLLNLKYDFNIKQLD